MAIFVRRKRPVTVAAPTFLKAGSLQASTVGLTYNLTTGGLVYNTDYTENDVALAVIESGNEVPPNSPWNVIGYVGSGTAGAALSVGLQLAWQRCSGGALGNPSFGDSGDHTIARVIMVRGCRTSGAPVVLLGTPAADSQSEPIPIPVANTPVDLCLVAHILAHGQDSSATFLTSITSAALASVTEAFDTGTLQGNGGGLAMSYGVKTTAGSLGTPTADLTSVTQPVVIARATVAFIPDGT